MVTVGNECFDKIGLRVSFLKGDFPQSQCSVVAIVANIYNLGVGTAHGRQVIDGFDGVLCQTNLYFAEVFCFASVFVHDF